ncbi:MAG: heme exporter protein CcmB [Leptospirales bacterium]|nr:heme exporter protein CcmB [Leptospirales bacterium]
MVAAPGFWRTFWRSLQLEISVESRRPGGLFGPLLFTASLAFLFRASLNDASVADAANRAALMLAALYVSATLAASRRIHAETEAGALQIQLMAPADAAAFFLAKCVLAWLQLSVLALLLEPLYGWLLVGIPSVATQNTVIFCTCSLALAPLATLGVYIGRGSSARELVTPALTLPAAIPIFLLSASALKQSSGGQWPAPQTIIALLASGALYAALGILLFTALGSEE